jgi:2-polyprenyl-6-methoxyphenol hydroxylase-like FAD-dependent oxidoreductase
VTTGTACGAGLSAPPHQLHADCCIVGAGPAGVMLALLLARHGLAVTLLEQHRDFERGFRGDTLHPSILQLLDDLGLAERLLQLPHTRFDRCILDTAGGPLDVADLRRLKTRFPYVVLMPQARFLDFVTSEARRYPGFRLLLGACAEALIEEGGIVRGIRYRASDGRREVLAPLTVGADGRFSRLRRLTAFTSITTAPPIDVIWFQLPRQPNDPAGAFGWIGRGRTMGGLDRGEHWEVACGFPAGSYRRLRGTGLSALREELNELAPPFAERLEHLRDWKQIAVLSVGADRLRRWYRPGLLLIGDAAHAMSPVAGVGISYAVQDAVVAANVLAGPLGAGRLRLRDLAAVQRRRELPTRAAQALLALLQRLLIADTRDRPALVNLPMLLRLPFLRDLSARLIAHGVVPVRLAPHLRR